MSRGLRGSGHWAFCSKPFQPQLGCNHAAKLNQATTRKFLARAATLMGYFPLSSILCDKMKTSQIDGFEAGVGLTAFG